MKKASLSIPGPNGAFEGAETRDLFVDSLPKNPSGKLLKRELRQLFVGGETLDKAMQTRFGT